MRKSNKLDVLSMLSLQMAEVVRIQGERARKADSAEAPSPNGVSNEEMRRQYIEERRFWNEGGAVMHSTQDMTIPTRHGSVRVRMHTANARPLNGCIFFIHGGGFLLGNVDTHDRMMRTLAASADCVLIGIDYTLSPEAKYPQAIEECSDVFCHFVDHAATYGLDPARLAFAGDSAGANLCMGVTLYMRDQGRNLTGLKALLLYYGLFGLRGSAAMALMGGPWDGLSEEELRFYDDVYVRCPEDLNAPYFNIFNSDLSFGIPSCYICGAELDPLVDDSRTLAAVLTAKNIHCVYKCIPGALHAFLHYTKFMDDANRALDSGGRFFKAHTD